MKTVLIVEDEQFLRSFLEKKFAEAKFEVTTALDGDDALAKLSDTRPSLVILDLILPKKTGFEVLAEMKKNPALSQVPVVVVSVLSQAGDIERAKLLGAAEYFIKENLSLEELVAKVRKILP